MNKCNVVMLRWLVLMNVFVVFPVPADELTTPIFGRLFTTDKERQRIDRYRSSAFTQSAQTSDIESSKKSPAPSKIVLQGFVKRSNGKNVVWVNDENTLNNRLKQQGIRVNTQTIHDNRVNLLVAGKRVTLKPGQTLQESRAGIIKIYKHP